jgi:hypothetical protein
MKNGKRMKPKSKTITIRVSQETSDRCEQLRLAMFPDRLTADCEAAPEAVRRTETKIIPFPGVSLKQGENIQNTLDDTEAPDVRGLPQSDSFQNEVDNFSREMGYIE